MKNIIRNISLILFAAIAFTGCYTVIWMPNENIQPTNDQNYQEDSYYPSNYYGEEYNYFYEYPWWYSLTPSTANLSQSYYNRDTSQTQLIRQRDSGRGGTGDRSGVIPTAPIRTEPSVPTASSTTTSSSNNSSNNSNANRVESSSSSKTTNSRDNSSNSNNTVRNNNGNRNSNGRN